MRGKVDFYYRNGECCKEWDVRLDGFCEGA